MNLTLICGEPLCHGHGDCESESCTVGLQLTYDYLPASGMTRAKGITTYVQEIWVLDKGQAWFAWRP